MRSALYKLAVWYIGRCNARWSKPKEEIKSLYRLTYTSWGKYLLSYGADAEWRKFSRYDVLDNAIQKLGAFEDIGTVDEFRALKSQEEIRRKRNESRRNRIKTGNKTDAQ